MSYSPEYSPLSVKVWNMDVLILPELLEALGSHEMRIRYENIFVHSVSVNAVRGEGGSYAPEHFQVLIL